MPEHNFIACQGHPLPPTAPEWIRVAPYGAWVHPEAGRFEVTADNAREMVANHQRVGMDRVVDFEHQTLHGGKAPAAGWIKAVENRSDGLWARVDWLDDAKQMIEARQYRYFSPVFDFKAKDPRSGKPIGALLHSIGLTNDPFLESDIVPLAAKAEHGPATNHEETDMALADIAKDLGLPEDATEEEIRAKLVELRDAEPETPAVLKALREELGLPEDADDDAIKAGVVALKAAPPVDPPTKGDGVAELAAKVDTLTASLDDANKQLVALKGSQAVTAATAMVDAAVKAQKLAPALREWALDYAQRDPEGFATLVDCSPKLLERQIAADAGKPDDKMATALTDEDLAVCKIFGGDPKEFAEAKAALVG